MFEVICFVVDEEPPLNAHGGRTYIRVFNNSARGYLPYYETAEGAFAAAWLRNLEAYKMGADLTEYVARNIATKERITLTSLGRARPMADDDIPF